MTSEGLLKQNAPEWAAARAHLHTTIELTARRCQKVRILFKRLRPREAFGVRRIPALSLCSLWGSNQSAGIRCTPNASRHSIAALKRWARCAPLRRLNFDPRALTISPLRTPA
jgi:hypothetical protein